MTERVVIGNAELWHGAFVTHTFTHLAARAKAAGYTLRREGAGYATASGEHLAARCYYASRWGHERRFDSLEEVARWLDTVTGTRGSSGDATRAYEVAKSSFLVLNPGATADEIEEAAKRAAREAGV